FKLVDIDVVAARVDDNVLRATDDVEPSLLIETPQVARMQPSIAEHRFGRSLVAVIAGHHVRPAHQDFADLTIELKSYFKFSQRLADRSRRPRVTRMSDADDRRRLSKA